MLLADSLREGEARSTKALFEQVWREHEGHLFKVCLRKLRDRDDAQDALASISITVLEKLPEVHGRLLNLRAWLVQVAMNHCVDVKRRQQRQHRIFTSEAMGEEDESGLVTDGTFTPEQQLLERQLWEVARVLIKALPPLLQEAADQHLLQQRSYPTIAASLGISQANVRKRVQKARDILRRQLDSYLGG